MNFRRRVTHGVLSHDPRTVGSAVATPMVNDAERERPAEERAATYARLLEEVLRIVPARLEESQLPLHILLESPFGELNENQEELLGAALNAIQAADIEVRQLRKLIDLERGRVSFVKQPMGVAELLRAPLAIAAARAEKAGVSHRWSVPIELPRVLVDPTHMSEALTTVLGLAIGRTPAGGALLVEARETEGSERVSISITHGNGAHADGANDSAADGLLARRTIELQGGTITDGTQRTVIELPAERLGTPSHVAKTSAPPE
jgi:signal transduction histidine kinase